MNNAYCFIKHGPLRDVIVSLRTGLNPRAFFKLNTEDSKNYYVTIREIVDGKIVFSEKTDRLNDEALRLCNNRSNLEQGDILFSGTGTIGEVALLEEQPVNWNIKEGVYSIKPRRDVIDSRYLFYFLQSSNFKKSYLKKIAGGTVKSIKMEDLRDTEVSFPPLEVQEIISLLLSKFDELCNDLSNGLPAEIEARQKQYEYYRDKLLSFKRKNEA